MSEEISERSKFARIRESFLMDNLQDFIDKNTTETQDIENESIDRKIG